MNVNGSVQPLSHNNQNEPTPEIPNSKQKSPLVVGLLVFSFLLLLSIGFLLFQNFQLQKRVKQIETTANNKLTTITNTPSASPEPWSDWKSYTSDLFEIKYPKDITAENDGKTLILSKTGPSQKANTEFYDGILLRIDPVDATGLSPQSYIQKQIDKTNEGGTGEIIVEPSQTTLGDYEAWTYTVSGLGVHTYTYIQTNDESVLIQIINSTNDPSNQNFRDITDTILSTFKLRSTEQQTEINSPLSAAKRYLNAYVSKDWETVKSMCADKEFNENIAESYGYSSYEIISSEPDTDPNYYHVFISLTDEYGTHTSIHNQPLEVLLNDSHTG